MAIRIVPSIRRTAPVKARTPLPPRASGRRRSVAVTTRWMNSLAKRWINHGDDADPSCRPRRENHPGVCDAGVRSGAHVYRWHAGAHWPAGVVWLRALYGLAGGGGYRAVFVG